MRDCFDERKSTEIAGLLLKLGGDVMHYMALIKLMYIIDREALKRWGYPLSGDKYYSLPHGPILSRVYELVLEEPELSESAYWKEFIIRHKDFKIKLRFNTPDGALSEAEKTLITEVFNEFGHLDRFALRDLTHTFPEWKNPGKSRLPISYEDILRAVGREKEADEIAGEIRDFMFTRSLLSS